ncbi:MAG TPA: hypothetical protein VFK24_10285 [Gammaproteobacteria bacterium]|nr:hypothetical protein [Gammaproteobacteria bacterium]
MKTALGAYVRARREALGYNPQTFAGAIGYHNRNKGARRLQALENRGLEAQDFVDRVLEGLGLDREVARDHYLEDEAQRRADWEVWADEPIRPYMTRREGPIFVRALAVHVVPEDITSRAALERHASEYARQYNVKMRLMVSRREALHISRSGDIEGRYTFSYDNRPMLPGLSIRGRRGSRFLFVDGATDERTNR